MKHETKLAFKKLGTDTLKDMLSTAVGALLIGVSKMGVDKLSAKISKKKEVIDVTIPTETATEPVSISETTTETVEIKEDEDTD